MKEGAQFILDFGVELPAGAKADVWPCYPTTFIRRPPEADVGDEAVPAREALVGLFGLVPHWAKDTKIGRQTYNARTETVHEKPSYRTPWAKRQFCLIPMMRYFEPCWETGKAVNWVINARTMKCSPWPLSGTLGRIKPRVKY